MASQLDEHTSFFDTAGTPLVGGSIYIGTVDLDPVANPITIYSDSGLTATLANPQIIDASGRATNKIYIPGKYSMQVDNSSAVQAYQNLDNGVEEGGGVSKIENVLGTNTITGEVTETITAYSDGEIYVFRTANANTGPVTVNWDSVGAKDLVRNQDQALLPAQLEADQMVAAIYNSTTDDFEWANQNVKTAHWTKGTDVASAAALDIAGAGGGNYFDITGTTTITSIGTLGAVSGTVIKLHFDGIVTITHNATDLVLPGAVNVITAANDEIEFVEYASGDWRLTNYQSAITGVVQIVNTTDGAVATGTTNIPFDTSIPQITEGDEFMTVSITPVSATSTLKIDVVTNATNTNVDNMVTALFQDTTADALAAVAYNPITASILVNASFTHFMTSGTTSATTFRVRIGGNTGSTTTFNGQVGAVRLGGVMSSSITIQEIIN